MSAPNGQYRGEQHAHAQHQPGYPPMHYFPQSPPPNGHGRWDLSKSTVPVVIVVTALASCVYFAFQAGDIWREHQTRLTGIEREIKDVKGDLGEIKGSLKELVSASAKKPPAPWPTAEVRRN